MRDHILPIAFVIPFLLLACDDKPESPILDTSPPVVWITAPSDSSTCAVADTIHVSAADDEGVIRVAAYADGDSLGEDSIEPYLIPSDFTRVGSDTLTVWARAWDEAGNTGVSDSITLFAPFEAPIDTVAPVVAITQPDSGQELDDLIVVNISVGDEVGVLWTKVFVDDVEIGTDEAPPYQIVWHPEPWGDGLVHVLVATASDSSGNVGESEPVSVTVYPQEFDTPEALAPAEGSFLLDEDLVTFTWSADTIAPQYRFDLATDPEFNDIVHGAESADTTLTITVTETGFLYWRVRAGWSQRAWGDWCPTREVHRGPLVIDGLMSVGRQSQGDVLARDPGGGALLAGDLEGKLLLLHVDDSGVPDWARTEHSLDNVRPLAICPRALGGWALFLKVEGSEYGLITLDEQGLVLDRHVSGGFDPIGADLVELDDGRLVSMYISYPFEIGSGTYLQAHDASAIPDWSHHVPGSGQWGPFFSWTKSYEGRAMIENDSGDLLLIGDYGYSTWDDYTQDYSYSAAAWLQGVDGETGDLLWERFLWDFDHVYAALPREGGGWIAAGAEVRGVPGLLFVEADLETSSIVPLGTTDLDIIEMAQLSSGDLVLAAERGSAPILLRCDLSGNVLWERTQGLPPHSWDYADMIIDGADRILALGRRRSTAPEERELWIQRLDAEGNDITP